MTLLEAVMLAFGTAAVNGAVTLAVVKNQLQAMRHQINAAHKRLDLHGAPPSGADVLP